MKRTAIVLLALTALIIGGYWAAWHSRPKEPALADRANAMKADKEFAWLVSPETINYTWARMAEGKAALLKQYGSQDAVDTVRHADAVYVFRVEYSVDIASARIKGPIKLSPSIAARLQHDFTDPRRYIPPEVVPSCEPNWRLLLVFRRASRQVNALYCDHCLQMTIDGTGTSDLKTWEGKYQWLPFYSDALPSAFDTAYP